MDALRHEIRAVKEAGVLEGGDEVKLSNIIQSSLLCESHIDALGDCIRQNQDSDASGDAFGTPSACVNIGKKLDSCITSKEEDAAQRILTFGEKHGCKKGDTAFDECSAKVFLEKFIDNKL